ncbi:hypothetical protein GCM10007971_05050 [Oceanobacillus indicireducens]|uniref:Uncharacterized protein n=1 Tax=Oceanobacillus indicireducens TaxID=1004261 RepID=A0A918CZB0_9BACI|nr:hypothetical protein GCM10007971_05050 [Oceanobacillus indicireducens]
MTDFKKRCILALNNHHGDVYATVRDKAELQGSESNGRKSMPR